MTISNVLPLLGESQADVPLAFVQGAAKTRGEFLAQVQALAAQLPQHRYVINLCQDRWHFMLVLAAACARGQTNLLPANQTTSALQVLRDAYDHYVADDATLQPLLARHFGVGEHPPQLSVQASHLAAICFTSGSTGAPQAHACTWQTLVDSARRSAAGIFTQRGLHLVATVPPQHMFGLETSILQPMMNRCSVHSDKPFFPADIVSALASLPAPRALITTPTHLRATLQATCKPPDLEFVLSATAPLATELAAEVESRWNTRVLEIYGSTETGAIGTRRTTDGATWHVLPGGALRQQAEQTYFHSSADASPVLLQDRLQPVGSERFLLLGRNADLVKVAGKRASLAELNLRLLAIPGVRDGVVLQPVEDRRVAALVVVDGLSERDILAALARDLDEVFLPRPIRIVAALPRDALGKLPREQLLAMLAPS